MADRSHHDRSITAAGLARLLERLDPDRDRASLEYETLRRTLIKFFDWRGAFPSDECADITLDRLARKLESEATVQDVRTYAHGIARLVLLEWRRQSASSPIDREREVVSATAVVVEDDAEQLRTCLDRCLDEIGDEARTLVLEYYEGERRSKIANRRRLAHTLGTSENALRSRVHRVRDRIEACVRACAGRK